MYCRQEQRREDAKYCDFCGQELTGVQAEDFAAKQAERDAINQDLLTKSSKLFLSTSSSPELDYKVETIGLVFGTSSKVAFWGLSTQADRLERAYSAALANIKYEAIVLGADGVLGVQFALNNSTGSSATLGGSSEAVMLLGTAFRFKK
jgi:uncharacterized protein YbjQ (UPF0145 family)